MRSNISSSTPGMVWPGLDTKALSQRSITLRNSSRSKSRNRCLLFGFSSIRSRHSDTFTTAVHSGSARRENARHDVKGTQHERAVNPADDVPHHELLDEFGVEHRGEHGIPCPTGAAGEDAPLDAELAQQAAQGLGAHMRFALPVELHVGGAAIGPVPEQHPIAAGDQRLGQRTQARNFLAEPATRCQDDEIACVTEDFVDNVATVHLDRRHRFSRTVTPSPERRCRRLAPGRCGCSTPA